MMEIPTRHVNVRTRFAIQGYGKSSSHVVRQMCVFLIRFRSRVLLILYGSAVAYHSTFHTVIVANTIITDHCITQLGHIIIIIIIKHQYKQNRHQGRPWPRSATKRV